MNSTDMQKFQKAKTFIQNFFTSITDLSFPMLKNYLKNLDKQISTKSEDYSSVTQLINNTTEGKGKKAMHFASARGDVDIVRLLVKQYHADINIKDSENYTPFFTAIQHSRLQLIKYFVQQLNVSANSCMDGEINGVHIAANNNSIEIIEYLISKGADKEKLSIYGRPLNWAVGHNNVLATKYLLDVGAHPDGDTTGPFPPPLIVAVDFENQEIYNYLIQKGASLQVRDPKGYSLLHVAAEKGNKQLVNLLLQKGVDVNYKAENKTALFLAFEKQKWEIVDILRNKTHKSDEIQKQVKELQEKLEASHISPQQLQKQSNEFKAQGNKYYEKKEYHAAIQWYTKAINVDPKNNILYSNRAAAYLALKDYEKSIENCQAAKKINPTHIKTLFREAQSYFGLKNYVQAAASYWQALKVQPNNKQCLSEFNKCVALGKQQNIL